MYIELLSRTTARANSNFKAQLLFIFLTPVLSGCDPLWDLAIDCIDDDRPVLSPAVLPNPILNQVYEDRVHVGIRNEPYDDSFDYTFRVSGQFPPGIQRDTVGRDLRIYGTPTALGDYSFTVRVDVIDSASRPNSTSGLCSTTDEQTYSWTIQPM